MKFEFQVFFLMASESRVGEKWTEDEHSTVKEYITSLSKGYILQGSDYDALAKKMGRTPGAIRLNIFSKAGSFAPETESSLFASFLEDRSTEFHVSPDDLKRYLIKRQNERRNGAQSSSTTSLVASIAELHDKIDRLTIIVSRLEKMNSHKA